MENAFCCLLLVAMATTLASGTYSSMSGFRTGYGWGNRIGFPVGMHLAGMGVARRGFPLTSLPTSLGYAYHRPLSYNLFGAGFGLRRGYGYGYYPRGYSRYTRRYSGYPSGSYGYSNGLYNSGYGSGFGRGFWPYSGMDDWDLDGFN